MLFREKHGHASGGKTTPEYKSWLNMIQRCRTPSATGYEYYGGRGIKVCQRWQQFENFLADMGPRPPGMTLDRYPDQAGNYEIGNCRWATPKEQAANRRLPVLATSFSANKSGHIGVCQKKSTGAWEARIGRQFIGTYPTIEDAISARDAAAQARSAAGNIIVPKPPYIRPKIMPNPRVMGKNNTTGVIGVYPSRSGWIVQFRRKHLGSFKTKEAAIAARRAAEAEAFS